MLRHLALKREIGSSPLVMQNVSLISFVENLLVALCVGLCIPQIANFVLTALYISPRIAVSHETASCSNLMTNLRYAEGLDLHYSG